MFWKHYQKYGPFILAGLFFGLELFDFPAAGIKEYFYIIGFIFCVVGLLTMRKE